MSLIARDGLSKLLRGWSRELLDSVYGEGGGRPSVGDQDSWPKDVGQSE